MTTSVVARLVLAAIAAGLSPEWAEEVSRQFVGIQSIVELCGGPLDDDDKPEPCATALLLQRINRPGAGQPREFWHLLPAREDVPRISRAIADAWAPEGARLREWSRFSEAYRLAWEGAA